MCLNQYRLICLPCNQRDAHETRLIKGNYSVVRQSPDADTIKFKAIDASHWNKIDTEFRDTFNENFTNENGVVPLRLQGIDALETHYSLPTISAPEGVIEPNPSPLEKPKSRPRNPSTPPASATSMTSANF